MLGPEPRTFLTLRKEETVVVRLIAVVTICMFLAGCNPSVSEMIEFSPVRSSSTVTLHDIFRSTGRSPKGIPPNLEKVVILGVDSTYYALSLFGLEDIVVLHLVVTNLSSTVKPIQFGKIALLDRSRSVLRRLEPHEAANIYLSHLKNAASYQPKQSAYIERRTPIQDVQPDYYTARSSEFRNPIGEAAYQAAYDFDNSFGRALALNRSNKYTQVAGILYALGIADGSSVPAKANCEGVLCWFNGESRPTPFRLRLFDRGEIEFDLLAE